MFEIVKPKDGLQSATIIDADTRESILAIDDRLVDGHRHLTPVFKDEQVARRVLEMLNDG